MGHAPQSFATAASERIRSGLSPKTIKNSAALLAPTPNPARRVGDVLGRESREVPVMCGDFLGEGEPGRWCTNRNWHATVPTTGASSTDGVGSWAAHVGHRIQYIARELRVDRSPTGCPGSKTIADDRRIPEEGVLDSRVLMVA